MPHMLTQSWIKRGKSLTNGFGKDLFKLKTHENPSITYGTINSHYLTLAHYSLTQSFNKVSQGHGR